MNNLQYFLFAEPPNEEKTKKCQPSTPKGNLSHVLHCVSNREISAKPFVVVNV